MSQTAKAHHIRDTFLQMLESEGISLETMAGLATKESNELLRNLFLGLGSAGREIYLIRRLGFINMHIRSEPPGWWNILKTVKKDLDILTKEFETKCYFVLLVGREDTHVADGYIATDFNRSPFLRPPGVEATKYTVNEKQHLDRSKLIRSVGNVAKALAKMRE